jgi:hypothetical protein
VLGAGDGADRQALPRAERVEGVGRWREYEGVARERVVVTLDRHLGQGQGWGQGRWPGSVVRVRARVGVIVNGQG